MSARFQPAAVPGPGLSAQGEAGYPPPRGGRSRGRADLLDHTQPQAERLVGSPPGRESHEEFAAFVDRYSTSLVRLAYLLLGDSHAAEDLAADVFLAAWRQWERISKVEYPLAYLRQMVTNKAATRHRNRARERLGLERMFAGVTETGHDPDGATVIDVRAALQRIPPRRRACLVLRFAFDLSEREVAQTLGITIGAVKSQTFKGLAQLRKELGGVAESGATPVQVPVESPASGHGWLVARGHVD
ncbi:MAG TPA: SigE family RNA polymerase sigma factor [Kineosporiaceae bacterium]|nr:SigE family RNA polymerase sigma factor [Kineosporiaceae bacterium]